MFGKKLEKNNVAIAFNVLYAKKEKIYPAYVSKYDLSGEKQVILLMIPNGKALLTGLTSKHHNNFYCQHCLHSFATKNKHEYQKIACGFCNAIMPSKGTKILEFNQYQKSDKSSF